MASTKHNSKRFFVLYFSMLLFGALLFLTVSMVFGISKLVVYPLVAFYLSVASFYIFYLSGRRLKKKFSSLGQAVGKSENDIFSVIGKPDQTESFEDGTATHSWTTTTFQIELHMKNGLCVSTRAGGTNQAERR